MDNKTSTGPKIKRRNVNPYGDIVTSDETFQTVYDAIEEEEKNAKRKKSISRKDIPQVEMESEEEVIEEEEEEPKSSSSSETSDEEDTVTELFPVFQTKFRPYLQNCWDTISPPFPESDLKAAWYAAIFNVPKRKMGILYIGRVTKRFLLEENGPVDCLELDCLKPASGLSSTILEEPPEHFGKDIVAGPLNIVYVEGKKWKFHEYPDSFL